MCPTSGPWRNSHERRERRSSGRRSLRGAAALLLVVAAAGAQAAGAQSAEARPSAQAAPEVETWRLTLGNATASVWIELEDGRSLAIDLREDGWWIDGSRIGSSDPDGILWSSWRSFLLRDRDGAGLPEALATWSPPSGLQESSARIAARLEDALSVLTGPGADGAEIEAELTAMEAEFEAELADSRRRLAELESEVREANARADRRIRQERRESEGGFWQPVSRFAGGLGNLLGTVVFGGLLALAGAFGAQAIPGNRVTVVSEVARALPSRSGVVGLMGSLLFLPGFTIPIIVLSMTVIGILLVPVWVLAFPLVFGVSAVVGSLAVARNLGAWIIAKGYPGTGWANGYNDLHVGIVGLLALFLLPVAGDVVSLLPFLSGLGAAIDVFGWLAVGVVSCIGLGAVILTNGGSRHPRAWDRSDDLQGID